MSDVFGDKILYCETCHAIGTVADMTPYKKWIFTDPYKHKNCGGTLCAALRYKPYECDDGSTGRMVASIRVPEWEAMTPAERKQVAIDNQAICDNSARMDKLRGKIGKQYECKKCGHKW